MVMQQRHLVHAKGLVRYRQVAVGAGLAHVIVHLQPGRVIAGSYAIIPAVTIACALTWGLMRLNILDIQQATNAVPLC